MMAELLALVDVGYVNLHNGAFQRTDAVLQGYAGVSIGAGIEDDAVVAAEESRLLHLVDELALNVTLVVVDLHRGIVFAQQGEVVLERFATVDAWLALSEEVQVRSVDN